MESKRKQKRFASVDDVLQLRPDASSHRVSDTVADDKVINYINKFQSTLGQESLVVKTIVCSSEASYFNSKKSELLELLQKNFNISHFSVSTGAIDSYIALYGPQLAIAKAATFLSFLLAKLNNFVHNQLTLKSPSYSLTILIAANSLPKLASAKQLSCQSQYGYNPKVNSLYFHGYLSNIFASLSQCLSSNACDVDEIALEQVPLFSLHLDANIVERSDENNQLMVKSRNNAIQFISKYSRISNLVA